MNFWANDEIYVELKDNNIVVKHTELGNVILPARRDAKPYRALLNHDSEYFVNLFIY